MVVHKRASDALQRLSPSELGLQFVSLQRLEVSDNVSVEAGREEMCIVILSGSGIASCTLPDGSDKRLSIGPRDMIFGPVGSAIRVKGPGIVAMAYWAPSEVGARFAHVRFSEVNEDDHRHVRAGDVGSGCARHVWKYIDTDFHCSRLMMGICENNAGNWTAWPPHEHTEEREEVYVYFDMGGGFGVQLVYRSLDAPDAALVVRDGDVVSIPGGYHPNVGAPAAPMAYIYCMAARVPGVRNFQDYRIQSGFDA